jgi:2-polyprenyl-3-methyl-5-hydroxy-6-metoxy-1,4-benzoquinol methylase
LLCPSCREPLDSSELVCANHHQYGRQHGVLVLLEDVFAEKLRTFTAAFSEARAADNKRLLDTSAYEKLPFIAPVGEAWEWRMRRYDLAVIEKLLAGRGRQRILDIGAWNGWLSHRLAAGGHEVTAVDYFIDPYDGLAAKQFYSTTWQAIQMDLTDLSILDRQYHVVILNRCLQFFAAPSSYVAHVQERVVRGGLLILTGLQIFFDERVKRHQVAAYRRKHGEQHGFEIFLNPTKGYLDLDDKAGLEARGVILQPYSQLWVANLKSRFNTTLPRHYYGVYTKT